MIAPHTTRRFTGDLNVQQRDQLAALLADTTAGAAHYRPPVARDIEVLRDLEAAALVIFTVDCGYEITDAGRELCARLDRPAADREHMLRQLTDADLLAALRAMPGALAEITDPSRHAAAVADHTAIRAEYRRREAEAELHYSSAEPGRHDREVFEQTLVFAAVEGPEGGQVSGTLPNLPVVPATPGDVVDEQDPAYLAQLLDAVLQEPDTEPEIPADEAAYPRLTDLSPDELARLTAAINTNTGLVAWIYRNLTMPRACVLTAVAAVLVTVGVCWLVMGR